MPITDKAERRGRKHWDLTRVLVEEDHVLDEAVDDLLARRLHLRIRDRRVDQLHHRARLFASAPRNHTRGCKPVTCLTQKRAIMLCVIGHVGCGNKIDKKPRRQSKEILAFAENAALDSNFILKYRHCHWFHINFSEK